MGPVSDEEIASLQREFDWVLSTEVDNVIKQLKAAVKVHPHYFVFDLPSLGLGMCQQVSHQGWRHEARPSQL